MVFKLKTKNGETKWEVRFRTNGRGSKEIRRRFETREDAETFLHSFKAHRLESQKSHSEVPNFEETTFKKESEYWVNIHKDELSPGYLYGVNGILNELLPDYGNLSPNKFHPGFLTSIRSDLLARGIKPATVNRKMNVITSILNFSAKQLRIPFSPTAHFRQLKETRDDIQCLTEEEAISFLSFANKKYPRETSKRWIYVVYLLALNAGPRAGEIWGLKPRDIIENGEVIDIQRQFDILKRAFRTTKGKENRRIPCNQELFDELQGLILNDKITADRTIFQASNRNPVGHDNFVFRSFKPDLQEWGGCSIRFHDLRHTAITLMISKGIDLKTVQEIAGHKDIKTTMNYVHLVAEKIRQTARIFSLSPKAEDSSNESRHRHLKLIHSV